MSDTFEELMKQFEEDVLFTEYPRSIGLFTIPEYPEFEERGMWSTAVDAILTTLRYLAPATLLTIFWGQQSFLFKFLKHIDSAFRAIVFSSDEQKQAVLQWLAEVGPVRVEHLDTVWRHGWILCGVLDGALPGACAGHPPTRLSLKHAQVIADTYLGVEPVFSRQELESCDSLSRHQEWKLATYLERIRLALAKLTPPVSRPASQRTSPDYRSENIQVTLDYVARGSGLTAAQVNNKAYFKIYPTAQQSLDPGELTILIRGPKDTYGMSVLPPILGKAQLIRQKLLGLERKTSFTESVLPITQGATYLRNYGKNDMTKTYFIPKTNYDIDIDVELRDDHARIGYVVNCLGKYEITITSRGQSIVGSPFKVTASNNIVGVLEKESFSLEDGEEIDIVDVKADRKVVLRIVDFVTEKMLLRENGCLEKITDDEAKYLLQTDNVNISTFKSKLSTQNKHSNIRKKDKFHKTAKNVIKMNRVCKILNDLKNQRMLLQAKSTCVLSKSQQGGIPDIVNSTFVDSHLQGFIVPEKQNRVIIPESISVSLRTEKPKLCQEDNQSINEDIIFRSPDYLEKYKISGDPFEDDELSVGTTQSSNNPFINDMYLENYTTEKKLGAFLATEYEADNSQNEEVDDSSLKFVIHEETDGASASAINPFVDLNINTATLERPKSPVYKIISGVTLERDQSLYIDCYRDDTILGNEFINPFFTHHHQPNQYKEELPVTDFIIGAPVSLPPILRSASPEPHLDSIVLSTDSGILDIQKDEKPCLETPSSINKKLQCESNSSGHSSLQTSSSSNDSYQTKVVSNITLPNISPKKDTWDSAYVSIDDNSSSPDSNNNDNTLSEPLSKQLFPLSDELSTMGPAEREIWETCTELKENLNTFKAHEETRISKRPSFTPIIEENDRTLYTDMKDSINDTDTDPVTTAFSELNEIFNDYFPQSEDTTTPENDKSQNLEVEYTVESNDVCVDSASENQSDVKRHVEELGGEISEVQASVTESDSASRILHVEHDKNQFIPEKRQEHQFGDSKYSNIVLEKKKYWDEKIRQIQAKSDEINAQQKKKKLTSKSLKHNDSLSKKKGKQMIKNFLNSTEDYQKYSKPVNVKQTDSQIQQQSNIQPITEKHDPNIKLVEKWKTFWDNKLETEKEIEMSYLRPKSSQMEERPKTIENLIPNTEETDLSEFNNETTIEPTNTRQEIPEEVFIAFETSPKRFFGTSRRQILSKIDTFLGKPNTDENSSTGARFLGHETGLVSSRISLFHKISNTEELPWVRRKCQSLHNLNQQKTSDKNLDEINAKCPFTKSVHDLNAIKTAKSEASNYDGITDSSPHTNDMRELNSMELPESNTTNSFEEYARHQNAEDNIKKNKKISVKLAVREFNNSDCNLNTTKLKTSISKSEMDIFSKVSNKSSDEDLDKHKSYEDLPRISVKNFISLYEGVSKSSLESKSPQLYKKNKTNSQKSLAVTQVDSSDSGTLTLNTLKKESSPEQNSSSTSGSETSTDSQRTTISRNITPDSTSDSIDIEIISNQDQDSNYLSLSDIEVEIIDKSPETSPESSPEHKLESGHSDYKNRFQTAKQYFQTLEELRAEKKSRKLNECEMLLYGSANESLTDEKTEKQSGKTKRKVKSNSLPSSELAKAWNELKGESSTKMVKISEKFNVEDLFNDVMEGRLSRQGSLRGIPHKKAVLETFKSMENVADKKLSSYELAVSQLNDFAKENQIKNAQTYLSEYPYLPTTDPSKYHSRLDTSASGLITFKELLAQKPRRNSVPDLRLNPTFSVDL